jgi:hypothetical protein
MIETSESIKEIATALAKAQAAMHGATKDGKNPAFKSTYASLASVVDAARGPLTSNGITFMQAPGTIAEHGLPITTMLAHTSGEWIKTTFHIPVVKRDPQGVGSATTYGCRYSLMAVLGLPPVDDDGEAAMGRTNGGGRQPAARDPQLDELTGAAHFVNDTQIATIECLFDEAGADYARFCRHFKIGAIRELPAHRYAEAVKALEAKRKTA